MAPSIAASAPQAAFPWTPGEGTLKRRLRARPPLGPVPQVDRMVDAQGCCGPLCEHDAQPPARPGPPPVRHDLVALLPEGGELLEGGRRWVRLPGGRPLLVDDAWATEAGGTVQDTVHDRVEQLTFDSVSGSGSTVQLALNAPMLFHHEDEGEEWYGPTEAIIDDLYQRGVRTVRHPGLAQMFLDKLLNMGRDPSTPILREAMSTPTDVASLVEASSSLSKLLTLAPLLRARQMKVIVTMLTLGGGSTPSPAETRDSVDGVAGRLRKSPAVHWGEDWSGTALTDDWTKADVPFNRRVGDWDTTTMDPANPCKRLIYRWVSRALGAWLDAHADELQDVLAGIEICNEVDVVQVFEADDKPGTEQVLPQHWGVLYADCAAELRMQCDWVPLWLPGLATYLEDGVEGSKDAWTFWGKVSFAGELIPVIDGYGIRQDLNADYRRKKASDAGLRPAGAMLQRIASLLGGRKVEAQVVWPEGYTRNDLAETRARRTVGDLMAAGTWPVQNHVCAVEVALFDPTAGRDSGLTPELDLVPSDYLYLLFIDGVPGWNEPSVTSTATPDPTPPAARVRLYLRGEGTVLQIPMEASSIVEADAGRDAFPSVSIAWPPDEALPILNLASLRYVEVVVHRGATPVLLSSSTRLQVEDVSILPIGVG